MGLVNPPRCGSFVAVEETAASLAANCLVWLAKRHRLDEFSLGKFTIDQLGHSFQVQPCRQGDTIRLLAKKPFVAYPSLGKVYINTKIW